jgi:hypothetical protein
LFTPWILVSVKVISKSNNILPEGRVACHSDRGEALLYVPHVVGSLLGRESQ